MRRLQKSFSFLFHTQTGHYVLIGLFALAAHGLLLLNDGVYWDGWLIYVGKIQDRWDLIYGIYADRGGLPVYTVFHWVLYQFPLFVFGYKLAAFLFIFFSTLLVYRISRLLTENIHLSLLAALIFLTFPADQANVELIVIPYLLSYFLFWLGCYLMVKAYAKSIGSSIWLHMAAVICLVLSFRMYSLLVYFYGVLFVYFLVWWAGKEGKPDLRSIGRQVLSYWAYLFLPILFWVGNAWLFPPTGPYANSDSFDLSGILTRVGTYFNYGLFGQLRESLANLANPIIFVSVLGISFLVAHNFQTNKRLASWLDSNRAPWLLIIGAVVLFAAGVFPYVAVGRTTALHGWGTRNAILIALPVAMMFIGLIWGLAKQFETKKPNISAIRIAVFLFSLLILLFTVETAKNYLLWQLRAIKDHSVIANVARQAEALEDISIFQVYDNFRVGGEKKYRPHEYFGMFAKAIPDKERIGFDVNYYSYETYFLTGDDVRDDLLAFWYPNLDIHGCQAELHISSGSATINPLIYARYFYYRFLKPERLDSFLYTVTDVDIVPIESSLATNCQQ